MDRRSHRSRPLHDLHTSAKTWRSRSGRLSGPEEYVEGDVVSSIFLHSRTMSQRERQELYGCPVLLVGVYSANGIPDTTPSTRLYISLRTTSKGGADMRSGRLVSHVVTPTTDSTRPPGTFDFDEVFTLGTQGDLSDVDYLTVRVKQLQGAFNSQRLVGKMSISLKQLAAEAGPDSPPFEAFFDVGAPPGAPVPGATVGSLHLRFFCEPVSMRWGARRALTRACLPCTPCCSALPPARPRARGRPRDHSGGARPPGAGYHWILRPVRARAPHAAAGQAAHAHGVGARGGVPIHDAGANGAGARLAKPSLAEITARSMPR